jgi:DNA-binding Lrp family transcriptional regulator
MAVILTTDPRLTTGEAARELGVSVQRVRQMLRRGELAGDVTHYGALLDPGAIARLRASREANPTHAMKRRAQ